MNPSTEDKIKGSCHEVKGAIKEEAGKVTNNCCTEAKGKAEKNAGKAQLSVRKLRLNSVQRAKSSRTASF
jgi:uncharacterized protein YjbJ (UPF0337 family)